MHNTLLDKRFSKQQYTCKRLVLYFIDLTFLFGVQHICLLLVILRWSWLNARMWYRKEKRRSDRRRRCPRRSLLGKSVKQGTNVSLDIRFMFTINLLETSHLYNNPLYSLLLNAQLVRISPGCHQVSSRSDYTLNLEHMAFILPANK